LAKSAAYKSLKYHVNCVTVGFRTLAAANPTWLAGWRDPGRMAGVRRVSRSASYR
jgi:hypothetical protein